MNLEPRTWLRRAAWTIVTALLLMLLAWLTLPWLIQSQGQQRLTTLLGRPVTIGKVDVKPWSLELTLNDVAIAGSAPQQPLLAVSRLYVNLQAASLWHRGVVIKALQVDRPAIRLTRNAEGHYDIDDLIARFTPKTPAEPAGSPARFALANVEVRDGSVRFDDRPAGRVHELKAFDLALPFVSDLPADVAVTVKPHLSFALNGGMFDSGAEATPFAVDRASSLKLRIGRATGVARATPAAGTASQASAAASGPQRSQAPPAPQPDSSTDELDLVPYLGYLPTSLPLRIVKGRVGAEIELQFATRPDGTPLFSLTGDVHVSDLAVTDIAQAPLFGWKRLSVALRDVQPLAHHVSLGAVVIDGATVDVTRDAQGRVNFAALGGPAGSVPTSAIRTTNAAARPNSANSANSANFPNSTVQIASAASAAYATSPSSAASSAATPAVAPPTPWQVTVDSFALTGSSVQWRDATTQPAAALVALDLSLHAQALQWPAPKPQPIRLSARIGVPGAAPASFATLTIAGPASDREAALDWQLATLHLDGLAPYLAAILTPTTTGRLDARGHLDWASGAAPRMRVGIETAQLSDFRLTPRGVATVDAAASSASTSRSSRRPGPNRDDAIAVESLQVAGVTLDLPAHDLAIASVTLKAPSARVERDAQGQWNALQWLAASGTADAGAGSETQAASGASTSRSTSRSAAASGSAASRASESTSASSNPPSPWRVRLADFALTDGRLRFADERPRATGPAITTPVRLDLAGIKVAVKGLDWRAVPQATSPPMQVAMTATVGRIAERQATNGPASLIDWQGSVALQPLAVTGRLRLQRIPVHVFAAYVDNPLRITLRRAYLGWRGDIALKQATGGLDVTAGGEARIGDLSVASLDPLPPASGAASASASTSAAGAASASAATPGPTLAPGTTPDTRIAGITAPDELLRWQRLQLNAVKFRMAPGSPPRLDIGHVEIADLYTRLVVTEQGRLNLQDVTAAPADAPASSARRVASGASSVAASPIVATASAASPAASSAMSINVEGTTLVNGRIDFADHFVKPNYSAALTELNGSLGAFHSGSTAMAALELKGRAEGSAQLEITGQLNPTADPLALDIHAKATDLELAPLSTYAGKYAGYAIQRGKLSMDVNYKIAPDGRLEASNRVVINQLTFGDRIESPQATKLPVRLAIALLKDRNGVINLNMPISGSLNDPQFSVVGLIGRVLFNVLVKAVTSPFALLGGIGGGGGEAGLSQIAFRPGTATLADGQQAALDKVAQALTERPSLNLTVTGESDPARETDAYRSALLDQQLIAERRRELIRSGGTATPAPSAASAPITLSASDRERLIKQVYERSDLPTNPKNFVGLAKGVPTAEMERLLTEAEPSSPEAMRELALQRGLAVRDGLIAKGLKSDRLFLAAPKVGAAAAQATKVADAAAAHAEAAKAGASGVPAEPVAPWVPRAELSLAAN